ncbi:hypothetical protein VNI00_007364 [Paramarasmius palmivorus]|uniref:Uncharacterized protein n=1 Tax=Paramarasmius palmivorus TaxID=297713 RepID=A0AAW0D3K4_9AGAR
MHSSSLDEEPLSTVHSFVRTSTAQGHWTPLTSTVTSKASGNPIRFGSLTVAKEVTQTGFVRQTTSHLPTINTQIDAPLSNTFLEASPTRTTSTMPSSGLSAGPIIGCVLAGIMIVICGLALCICSLRRQRIPQGDSTHMVQDEFNDAGAKTSVRTPSIIVSQPERPGAQSYLPDSIQIIVTRSSTVASRYSDRSSVLSDSHSIATQSRDVSSVQRSDSATTYDTLPSYRSRPSWHPPPYSQSRILPAPPVDVQS